MFTPKYTITPEINSRIAEIERLRTVIDHATILPEIEVNLRFRATVESVHGSTSIEGNPLNENQVRKVLKGEVVRAPDYAIIEVVNYKKALNWLGQLEQTSQSLKPADILTLHKLLMTKLLPDEKVGHWRPGPVYVVDEIKGKDIVRYTGPDAEDVPHLITSFLQWIPSQYKTKHHPVLLAGLIHYLFVSIHPFSDGNGRTTRLITQHYLKTWHYDFRESLSLDSFYLQHQLEYYQALSRGSNFENRMSADMTPFLDFFTRGFLETAQTLNQYITVGKVPSDTNKPLRLSSEELTILDFTHQFGSITIKETMTVLNLPQRTALRRLAFLVEKHILKMEGEGPATKYVMVLNQ
jgi:Fic family protein